MFSWSSHEYNHLEDLLAMCLSQHVHFPKAFNSSFHFPSCQSLPPCSSMTPQLSKCWTLLTACSRSYSSSKFTWSRVLARVLHYICQDNAFKSINYFLSKFIFQPLCSSNLKSSPMCIPTASAGTCWLVLTDTLVYRIPLPPCQDHHLPSWVMLPLTLSCRTLSGGDMGCILKRAYVSLRGKSLFYIVFLEWEWRRSCNQFLRYSIRTIIQTESINWTIIHLPEQCKQEAKRSTTSPVFPFLPTNQY